MTLRVFSGAVLCLAMGLWAQTPAAKAPATAKNLPRVPGVAGLPPAPPALPHPTTEAQLRQFLQVADAQGNLRKDINQTMQLMRQQAPPYFPVAILGEVDHRLQTIDLVQLYLPYYQAYLSEPDMAALLNFYRTEAGKHYAAVQPQLVGSANMVLSGTVQSAIQSVMVQHRDEILAAKKRFEAAQKAPGAK